jgi:hypothetical protein
MKRFSNVLVAFTAAIISLSLLPTPVSAASNSIGINPRKDFTINSGDKVQDKLTVKDLDAKVPLDLSIRILDFKAAGQNGEPSLLLKQTDPTRWSLKPYLTIQSTASVAAGNFKDIPFTISIPKTLGAGSYYSAVQFSTGSTGGTGNVGLSSSAVSLIFVTVPGKASHSLTMKQFGAFVPTPDFTGGSYKDFYGASKPKFLSYTIQNNGNVVEQPIGSIQIKNIFGKQYKLIQNVNPNHNLVLLGQSRRIDLCIQEPSGTNLDNTDQSIENLSKFWYLPAWFIIAVIVAILVLVGIVLLILNLAGRRSRNRYRSRR